MGSSDDSASDLTREELKRFAEEKREIIENNPQMNEEETKTAIVTDFVNLLGWEIPQDGNMEYQFGDHNTNVVDYAFLPTGTSKLFVEAKSQGTTLQEKHQNQLREYLMLDNVDLGILTNGEVYELYRRFVTDDGNVETQRIDQISLSEFPEYAALINIFSKIQVTDETYVERLKRINDLRQAQDALEDNHEQLSNDIVEVLTEIVGKIAEQPAKENIADFLDSVDAGLSKMTPAGPPDGDDNPYDVIEAETGVEFSDGDVHFAADGSARDHIRDVIQVLFGHGHLTLDDLPIPAGPTRYILNTKPTDREGDKMANGEEVVDGVYVELNASKETLKQFTETIVETIDETHDLQDSTATVEDSVSTGQGGVSVEMRDGDIVVDGETGDPLFSVTDWNAISGKDSAKVGVYASDFDRGLPFVADHNAWGFINIASEPEYFCIYVNRPYQQIQLIGVVEEIIDKDEFIDGRELDRDPAEIADSKKVIAFSDVYQLESPIQIGENSSRMQGLLYTTLGELKAAGTTDDL